MCAPCVHYWHGAEGDSQEAQESAVRQQIGQLRLSGLQITRSWTNSKHRKEIEEAMRAVIERGPAPIDGS